MRTTQDGIPKCSAIPPATPAIHRSDTLRTTRRDPAALSMSP